MGIRARAILTAGSIAIASIATSTRADDAPPSAGATPVATHVEKRLRRWPILVGSAVFAGGYAWSALVGVEAQVVEPGARPYLQWLYVPVVGPFVAAARYNSASTIQNVVYDAGFVFEGIVQTAGLAILTFGLVGRETVVAPDVSLRARVVAVPLLVGGRAPGLAVAGCF